LESETIAPLFWGNSEYSTLVVCWGTNLYVVKEALAIIGRDDIAALHFSQIYPLHPQITDYFAKATKTILIENNATAQFGKLIKLHTGLVFDKNILKYNGEPFSVEEVVKHITENCSLERLHYEHYDI